MMKVMALTLIVCPLFLTLVPQILSHDANGVAGVHGPPSRRGVVAGIVEFLASFAIAYHLSHTGVFVVWLVFRFRACGEYWGLTPYLIGKIVLPVASVVLGSHPHEMVATAVGGDVGVV